MTKKKPVPKVAEMLDECLIKLNEFIYIKDPEPKDHARLDLLNKTISALVSIDKNDRDIKAAFAKHTMSWSDEKLEEELNKLEAIQKKAIE